MNPPTSPLTYPITAPSAEVRAAVEQAAGYAAGASAAATRRAYTADWTDWRRWCEAAGVAPLPTSPAVVGAYLADMAHRGLAVATIARRLSAIATAHRQAGHHLDIRHPAVRDVLKGIRRRHGTAPRKARAATTPIVKALVSTCGDGALIDIRDRAVVLLGFASALRRSELVALEVDDVEFGADGARLRIRRSKGDPEGAGETVGVLATGTATCPVAALQMWLRAAGIASGPVFRSLDRHGNLRTRMSGEAVAMAVQRRAAMAGLDPAGFSAHSLRAGLATSAAAAGVPEADIQRQTRHKSVQVLRGYVRHGSVFRNNASGAVGL